MEIRIYKNSKALFKALSDEYIGIINGNPNVVLGLATGGTPKPLYKSLREAFDNKKVSFQGVTTFNLDEYIGLEPTHPQSYRHFMNEQLFNHVDINIENTFVPLGVGNIAENIEKYEAMLHDKQIDVQLLGIGTNGHIAFNEPGVNMNSFTQEVELVESTVKDNSRYFDSIEDVPKRAITMGIKSIKKAKKIILIATGVSKADAIYGMVKGRKNNDECPASYLQTHHNVVVYIDEAAASKII